MKHYATLKPLTPPARDDAGDSLRAMADVLSKSGERGTIHLRLHSEGKDHAWSVDLGAKGAKVSDRASGKPALEIVTRGETWEKIAQGTLSPLEAFVTGRLRVRGDAQLGKRLIRLLSDGQGEIEICA